MKLLGVPGKGALIWWRYNTFSPKTYPRCYLVDVFHNLQIEHWPRGATSGASSNSAAMTKFTGECCWTHQGHYPTSWPRKLLECWAIWSSTSVILQRKHSWQPKYLDDNNNTPEQRSRINQVNYVKISLYQFSCISFCFFCITMTSSFEKRWGQRSTSSRQKQRRVDWHPESEVQRWNI